MKNLIELFEALPSFKDEDIHRMLDEYAAHIIRRDGVNADLAYKSSLRGVKMPVILK